MKKIMLSITLLLSTASCFAQNNIVLKNDEIRQRLENSLNSFYTNLQPMDNFCGRGSVFIKLKMDSKNDSINIALTKDSSKIILAILSRTLSSLQSDKALIYSLRKLHRTFLIPLIYNFEAGCDLSIKSDQKEADKSWLNYELAMSNLYTTILDMLNFSDGKLNAIDCILLSPCRIGAVQ